MSQPGDRVREKCKGCGAQIVMVMTSRGKWIPCDPARVAVDGERVLVFANGVVGRRFKDYSSGLQSHFSSCPKAAEFRRKKAEPKADKPVIGCGCLGGPH